MKKPLFFLTFLVVALVLAGVAPVFGGSAMEVGKQAATQAVAQTAKININTADVTQLESLPGIGSQTAEGILEYRETHGAFKSVEEIKEVKGIGDKKYETLKDLITVE